MTSHRNRMQGFSLLEVMITLFVVAVGLLSVAGLQTLSKKSNFDALQRTQAAALAQDLIERIRANPSQGNAYRTDLDPTGPNGPISESNMPAAPALDCNASNGSAAVCTPAQVAAFDRYQWARALLGRVESVTTGTGASATTDYTGGLSSPTACIVNSNPPCGVYTITIVWRGITPLPKATSSDAGTAVATTCGDSESNYIPPGTTAGGPTTLRRVLVVQTMIDDHNGTCG